MSHIFLDDAMPREEQKKTGVADLSYQQKLALEQWLNDNFVQKKSGAEKSSDGRPAVYLSENINNGKQLKLSDGSLWDVAPQDANTASFWIIPFPLCFMDNTDTDKEDYPKILVNQNTGVGVKVKMLKPPLPNYNAPPDS